jgi:hypothetical protein
VQDAAPVNLYVADAARCKLEQAADALKPAVVRVNGGASLECLRLIDALTLTQDATVLMDDAGVEDLVADCSQRGGLFLAAGASAGSATSELYAAKVAAVESPRGRAGTPSLGASNTYGSQRTIMIASDNAGRALTVGTLTAVAGETVSAQAMQNAVGDGAGSFGAGFGG